MTSAEAKEILILFRAGIDDPTEPEFAEALALAQRDPELARWLEEQAALFSAVRAKLREIEASPGAIGQVLRNKPGARRAWWQPVFLAAAAAILLLLAWGASFLRPREEHSLAIYRQRMVRNAVENYAMDYRTNDLEQIRQFLAKNGGHSDYRLSKPLAALPGDGCAVLRWHNRRVSMICFDLGNRRDLYLFVIDPSDLSDAPAVGTPKFTPVSKLMTASWTEGGKTYLLAGAGDEAFLRRFP